MYEVLANWSNAVVVMALLIGYCHRTLLLPGGLGIQPSRPLVLATAPYRSVGPQASTTWEDWKNPSMSAWSLKYPLGRATMPAPWVKPLSMSHCRPEATSAARWASVRLFQLLGRSYVSLMIRWPRACRSCNWASVM